MSPHISHEQRGQQNTMTVSCNRMSALMAPSGECLRCEGLVWLIGAVVCSLAAAVGQIVV